MRLRKSWILSLAMVFVLSMVLAACGGGDPSADGGDMLIVGRGADSKALDPIQVTDGESIKVTHNIFETLVKFKEDSTEVEPGLAKEWEVSDDGKTWTFHLEEGVKFHDGTDFNADAVVFNFERWMDKDHPQHKGGDFIYYKGMFGGFKGEEGHVIKSVKALDEHTVQFELNFPQGPFLANLAMAMFGIASPEAVKKDPQAFNENPVGTGPFKFKEWKKGDSITLVKNENYWKKGYPKLDGVIFKSIPDNSARFTALQSGEIDLMDGLNIDDAKQVESNKELALYKRPPNTVGYLAFNMEKKPFNDKKVRQALNMAVNKDGLVKTFFGDLGEPAKNPMPPSLWGYNDDVKDYEYNPEKAKKLLAEAGYPDGFSFDLWAMPEPRPYMPDGKKIAEYLQANFEKIGVKANIVSYEWATYLEKTENGEHDTALLGWTGDNGDPDNFLYVLLDKDNATKPAQNIAFYKSDPLHDLLIKAQRLSDQDEREALYLKAQEIIKEDAPWITLAHATPPVAAKASIKGYVPHATGSESLEKVSIEK